MSDFLLLSFHGQQTCPVFSLYKHGFICNVRKVRGDSSEALEEKCVKEEGRHVRYSEKEREREETDRDREINEI